MDPRTWRVSTYRDARTRSPHSVAWTLEEMSRALGHHIVAPDIANKRDLPAWSPAHYPPGATRRASSVTEISCLVLDVDDGTSIDTIWSLWPTHARILHTSWSHTSQHPKARLVVPVAQPIPRDQWHRAWSWAALHARRHGVAVDRACSDASRIYFLPASPSASSAREVRDALDLPVLEIPARRLVDPARAISLARRRVSVTRDARTSWQDPDARETAARSVGATLAGEGADRRAEDVTCPICARPSVYWYLTPRSRSGWAACSHRQSCGWRGPISSLPGVAA